MRFMIHIPVNIRAHLVNDLRDHQEELEGAIGEKLEIYTPHDDEYASEVCGRWLLLAAEKQIVPDLILFMAPEYAISDSASLDALFSRFAGEVDRRHPITPAFRMLVDEVGLFYPFAATPLTMLYNTFSIKESQLLHSWEDLFNPKFRILFPDRDKPLCRAAGAYLLGKYPDQFAEFESRVTYDGSPASVGKAVISGEYDIAMTLASFAQIHEGERVAINHPKEGNILMPQVLVCKRGAERKVWPVLEYMMNRAGSGSS